LARTASNGSSRGAGQAGLLGAAFRDLHGGRIHGFALLVTLGDHARAASIARDALAAGVENAASLHHPERAAAWLRARVVQAARHRPFARRGRALAARREALAFLGADARTFVGLAALNVVERAAIVALDVERLDPRDVEVVMGLSTGALERVATRARRRYAAAWMAAPASSGAAQDGELARQVRDAAHRTLS
jgi:DNA-directed RNA polymerase specialized sigma24 family protein